MPSSAPAPPFGIGDSIDPATSFLGLSLQHQPADAADAAAGAHHSRVTLLPGTREPLAAYTKNCMGKFHGDWDHAFPGAFGLAKWKATGTPPKFPTPEEAARLAPSVDKLDAAAIAVPPGGPTKVQATWMGHASFLVQVGGVNILTDPVWSQRCAPFQFAGPKRFVQPPVEKVADIPVDQIDIVTISHNHYDHLDAATVSELRAKFQPTFVVPLGMKAWFRGLKWKPTEAEAAADITDAIEAKVIEMDWWESTWIRPACHNAARRHLSPVLVTFVPVQHWSMRTGPWDRDAELWGGFVIEVDVADHRAHHEAHASRQIRRVFHCGDTGYQEFLFRQIGKVFHHHFDLAMLPIGAYHPRWFLQVQHVDPDEAVRIHCDLGRPALSLGMHWGTFILTDEPIDEPPKLLRESLQARQLPSSEFVALKHGETVVVDTEPNPTAPPAPVSEKQQPATSGDGNEGAASEGDAPQPPCTAMR
jgi:L-ascorbate metabolism protein UlaG (beta-lactamase superfamily)